MDDPFTQAWQEIASRPTGPMAFRFYLQPVMATIFAVRDGGDTSDGRIRNDAVELHPPP